MAAEIDLNSLMSSVSRWEIAGYISVAAVSIGVIGEFIHDFVPSFKRRSPWWNAWGGKTSGLILIAALAAELITQVKANSMSGQIIAFLSDRTATTLDRAATLGVTVDTLSQLVARKTEEADKAIASLNAATAKADETISAIQKQQAQRRLREPERSALISALTPYAGQKIQMYCPIGDDEACTYRDDFVPVFEAAGWDHDGDKGTGFVQLASPLMGMGIMIPGTTTNFSIPRGAPPLLQAMIKLGILDEPNRFLYPNEGLPVGMIQLYVGKKLPFEAGKEGQIDGKK